MLLTDISIKRPVFATVMSVVLVIFGLVVFKNIPVRELPNIDPSIVTVRTLYAGASAEIVDSQITQILEDAVGGTEGILNITSTSVDGQSTIRMEFALGVDVNEAANDVRDAVSRVVNNLPTNSSGQPLNLPQVFKTSESNVITVWLRLRSKSLSQVELTDYAVRYLQGFFSSVPGVGQTILSGDKQLSIRIWLNPIAMAAKGVTEPDIENVLNNENIDFPTGKITSKNIDLVLKLQRNYQNVEDFKNLAIKKLSDGSVVRIKDIGKVEVNALNIESLFKGNGDQVVGIGLYQTSDANTIDVSKGVKERLKEAKQNLPSGMELDIAFDRAEYISAAVNEVYKTLFISVGLVVAIIYLFLGNFSAVIIPTLAIPVSLISTFLAIRVANFSINLFTLMALVVAIGLVVDDAIVMLENIYRRMEEGETALIASYKGASQVSFAIIATTVVLIAVFMPLIFVKGIVGKLFTELALTLAFSVSISAFVALTLSPMLASKYLKITHIKPKLAQKFDDYLGKFTNFYFESLQRIIHKKKEVIIFLASVLLVIFVLFKITPKELIPPEDRGVFYIVIQSPDGTGYEYTKDKVEGIEKNWLPRIGKGQVREVLARIPGFGASPGQVNSGLLVVLLENWDKRKAFGARDLGQIFQELNKIAGVKAFPIMAQSIRGSAVDKPIQFVLKGNTYEQLLQWKEILEKEIANNRNLVSVDDDLSLTIPQLVLKINKNRAADLGINVNQIGQTLQTMYASKQVTNYLYNGRSYNVMLQADLKNRLKTTDLENIYLKSSSGKLVPLSSVASYETSATFTQLNRYNRERAVTINARLVGSYTIENALTYLEQLVKQKLPAEARIDYKGESYEYKNTSSDIYFIFFLALFTAYLSLAAQFESWKHPLTIMLTVPLAILGGIIGLWIIGGSINIYSQIALVVLIGLAAKNGILIVEFANQLRAQGKDAEEAIIESCRVRLRPILMTSLATVVGVTPLIIATGAGSASRMTVGIVIFMGIFFSTLFTLYIIPTMYLMIGRNTGTIDDVENELNRQLKDSN